MARRIVSVVCVIVTLSAIGCTARHYRREADQVAHRILAAEQEQYKALLGEPDPFDVESTEDNFRKRVIQHQDLPISHEASLGTKALEEIDHWPASENYLESGGPPPLAEFMPDTLTSDTIRISLVQALQIAAFNSREYKNRKEEVFQAALRLDLEDHRFENTFTGLLSGLWSHDKSGEQGDLTGYEGTGSLGLSRRFRNGLLFTARLGIDLAGLLENPSPLGPDTASSKSVFADITATLPLLRGGGKFVVTEPLKQAERNLIYALFNYESFKREFAVQVASNYLAVLQQLDQVRNAEENYRGLIASARRARRLADAGILPEIQFDQAIQDELRARDRWISSIQSYNRSIDQFKIVLGIPTDSSIVLDRDELDRLAASVQPLISNEFQKAQFENIQDRPGDQLVIAGAGQLEDSQGLIGGDQTGRHAGDAGGGG